MENNMLKDYLSILVVIVPAMVITFFASEMLDESYDKISTLNTEFISVLFKTVILKFS